METGNEVGRTSEALAKRLERHPEMKPRIGRVPDVLENTSGDLIRAETKRSGARSTNYAP